MRISVDRDLCVANGQCEFTAPDLFRVDDNADLEILDETPPQPRWVDVERAVRACPTGALSLTD